MAERYYSPRIARQLITLLYHEARARQIPMTVLVNQLITDGLAQSSIVAESPAEVSADTKCPLDHDTSTT
jgi:hypothetical protein